jgi:chromosome segregation ATPase
VEICGQLQALTQAMEAEHAAFMFKLQSKDEAANSAQKSMQEELETARDDCDDLRKRIRVAERQLARLRKPQVCFRCTLTDVEKVQLVRRQGNANRWRRYAFPVKSLLEGEINH